jgi:hypothetical protein
MLPAVARFQQQWIIASNFDRVHGFILALKTDLT